MTESCIIQAQYTQKLYNLCWSDLQVYIYGLVGTTLTQKTEVVHLGPVTDVAYSPDNKYLVACDANRKVVLYAVPEYKVYYISLDIFITRNI